MRATAAALLFLLATATLAQATPSLTSVDSVLDPFRRGRFEELEGALDRLAREDARMDDGARAVDSAFSRLADMLLADESLVPRLEAWRKSAQGKPWADLAQARFEEGLAWRARGGGFARSVAEDAWPVFRAHLDAAEASLSRALSRAPGAREALAARVRLALHRGLPKEELAARFEEALAADPVSPDAHEAMFLALDPAWGGSKQARLAFARESARRHPEDPYLHLLLVHAHRGMVGSDAGKRFVYYRTPEVWAEVSGAAESFLERIPDSEYGHNLLAQIASLAGERDVARRELRWIGERRDPRVWDDAEFARVRQWSLSTRPAAGSKRLPPGARR